MTTPEKNEKPMNRRDFLRILALGAGGAALAACSPKVAELATQAPTAAVAPTSVPATAAALVPTLSVPPTAVAPKATTIMWESWGGADRFTPLIQAWANTYPDTAKWLTVKAVSGGKQDAEMYQQLRTALAANGEGLPDFFEANAAAIPELATRGLMADLTDKMKPFLADLLPSAVQLASFGGKVVSIPTQVKSKVWYYRKDLFDNAGIDPAQIKTFDDFIAAGKQYHAKNPDSFIINLGPQPIAYWYGEVLSTWDDIRFADETGKWFVKDDPHFATLLDWTKKIYDSGIAFKTDDWSSDWQPAIGAGKIGSFLIGSWMTSFIPQFAPDQKGKWALALWPEFSREGSEAGGAVVGIPAVTKNMDAAFEFCSDYWLKPEGSVAWWQATGLAPLTKSGQDALKKMIPTMQKPAGMTDADWGVAPINYYGKDFMDTIFESMQHVKVFPYDMSYAAEQPILAQHTEAYLSGKETLQKALEGAQADMESQIGNPYKI
jgi:ABC-type glycerol-3-phosphate transport system substrate-binding protein